MNFELLKKRGEIVRTVRDFFYYRDYLELETPCLSPHLIPEAPIEIFKTNLISPYGEDKNIEMYLTPSPEIWMKKALSEGSGNIFQITKSFRNSEQKGKHHNNEFSMIEWYTVNADYNHTLTITEELFSLLSSKFNAENIKPPFIKISMKEVFFKYTGIDLEKGKTAEDLHREIEIKGVGDSINPEYNWEEAFNSVFLTYIEPMLPSDKPVALFDYPVQIPCLAKKSPDNSHYERWELYVNGIETANCYTEETDKKTIDHFFRNEYALKQKSAVNHCVDFSYPDIFNEHFPPCSGAAMGIDRLVMAVSGCDDIKDILSVSF